MLASEQLSFSFDFGDPNWRVFSRQKLDELGVLPNQLLGNNATKRGAVVVKRAKNYSEFALSQAAVNYLQVALQEGRIKEALVILVEPDTNKIVEIKPLADVVASLEGVEPRTGTFGGPFWWLNADGTLHDSWGGRGARPYPYNETPF
jgi:hypothetical protein